MVNNLNNSTDDKIIAALLQYGTIREAAAQCGLSERTIYNKLKKPEFKQALQKGKALIISNVSTHLTGQLERAVKGLLELLDDPGTPPSVKLMTCKTIMEQSIQLAEMTDIYDRLDALER